MNEVPGPGTYGKGGIPAAMKEEVEQKSASTVGLLDAGWTHATLFGDETVTTNKRTTHPSRFFNS